MSYARRGRWVPRLHPAWIVVLFVCAFFWRDTMHAGLTNDAYWQRAAGDWMLAHHRVIRSDVFSYTVRNRPWTAEEWGFEVLLAWTVRTFGPLWYWILSAGACTAALLASVARWRLRGAAWLWTATLAIVAGVCLLAGLAERPQDLSYLFFALALVLLDLARRSERWLFVVPVLFAVWANVHGSFLAGLGLVAVELVVGIPVVARLTARTRLTARNALRPLASGLTLGASVVASFANPHGPGLLAYAFRVTTSTRLSSLIEEWQSPDFHSWPLLVLVLGPAIAVVAVLALSEVELALGDLIIWGVLFVATLRAQRFLPYLGMSWAGLAATWPWPRRETIRASLLAPVVAALGVAALLVGAFVPPGAASRRGQAPVMPVAATSWLAAKHGRVFSTYSWNDYLIGQGIPVFVDGRTDLYFGTGILTTYIAVSDLTAAPEAVFDRWHVRWVLWPPHSALAVYLAHDPRWQLAYRTKQADIFGRAGHPRSTSSVGPTTSRQRRVRASG